MNFNPGLSKGMKGDKKMAKTNVKTAKVCKRCGAAMKGSTCPKCGWSK